MVQYLLFLSFSIHFKHNLTHYYNYIFNCCLALPNMAQKDCNNIKGNPHLTVIGYITEEANGMNLITRGANQ